MITDKLKSIYCQIKEKPPGRRFRSIYDERHLRAQDSTWQKIGFPVLGAVLIMVGGLLSIPPGVPGFIVILVGLSMVAMRSRHLATLLDYAESKLRRFWRPGKNS